MICQNQLQDLCHSALLGLIIEAGSGLTPNLSFSGPADVLVNNWSRWSPAAFDFTVTSPLTPFEASVTFGIAALVTEQRKHLANDPKCHRLGWTCIPLAVECYGFEARQTVSRLASCLSFSLPDRKSNILMDLYGRLNTTLVRCSSGTSS